MKALTRLLLFPLAFLLHHANRAEKSSTYYNLKKRILSRFGTVSGEDVQFIEGKECYYCHHYEEPEDCSSCDGTGWYKRPFYSLLQRVTFGGYIFHQPIRKIYLLEEGEKLAQANQRPRIEGYISHTPTRLSIISLNILYLLYEPKHFYLSRLLRNIGTSYWDIRPFAINHLWLNFLHVLRYGVNAPLIRELKKARALEKNRKAATAYYKERDLACAGVTSELEDELPF